MQVYPHDSSVRPGSTDGFLVAAQQCLSVTDVVAEEATVCTSDASGSEWCLSMGDPGILEAHPRSTASIWTITHDAGDMFDDLPAYSLVSGLCASWSAEVGASGPLPHTRYMLIEAQQRLNGGGCANGGFTLPDERAASGGAYIRPASLSSLPSDDHVGGVVPRPANEWC